MKRSRFRNAAWIANTAAALEKRRIRLTQDAPLCPCGRTATAWTRSGDPLCTGCLLSAHASRTAKRSRS